MQRLSAFVLCVVFAAVFFCSTVFIAAHANHKHDQDGPNGSCAACAQIAAAADTLKQLSGAAVFFAAMAGVVRMPFLKADPILCRIGLFSLVSFKVRLNN